MPVAKSGNLILATPFITFGAATWHALFGNLSSIQPSAFNKMVVQVLRTELRLSALDLPLRQLWTILRAICVTRGDTFALLGAKCAKFCGVA
jgi:hypothetical protein